MPLICLCYKHSLFGGPAHYIMNDRMVEVVAKHSNSFMLPSIYSVYNRY